MKEISLGQLQLSDYRNESNVDMTSGVRSFFRQAQGPLFLLQIETSRIHLNDCVLKLTSSDVLYYRTKWPWPLKDRDYALARRCRVFPAHNAVVFISKSVEVWLNNINNVSIYPSLINAYYP